MDSMINILILLIAGAFLLFALLIRHLTLALYGPTAQARQERPQTHYPVLKLRSNRPGKPYANDLTVQLDDWDISGYCTAVTLSPMDASDRSIITATIELVVSPDIELPAAMTVIHVHDSDD
jgi:hypothetical protein